MALIDLALSIDSENQQAHLVKAMIKSKMGDDTGAHESFKKCADLDTQREFVDHDEFLFNGSDQKSEFVCISFWQKTT